MESGSGLIRTKTLDLLLKRLRKVRILSFADLNGASGLLGFIDALSISRVSKSPMISTRFFHKSRQSYEQEGTCV
jgi:hypothetical protein